MATAVRIMLPERQKDLTRRAVLRRLPFSNAAIVGSMPLFTAASTDGPHVLSAAENLARPALSLPFVRDTTALEHAAGALPSSTFGRIATQGRARAAVGEGAVA